MTDLERIFHQIVTRPEEDAPRRQYADALPAGNPRADFIRQQIELATLQRQGVRSARRVALTKSTAQLLAAHADRWAQPLLSWTGRRRFSRGFVQHVEIEGPTLLRRFDDLLQLAPVLSATLTQARASLAALAQQPQLQRLLGLDLDNQGIGDAGLLALLASPHVRNLRYLSLNNNDLSEKAVEALFTTPNLPALEYVALARNPAPDPIMSPAGQDWESGAALDYEWSAFGRSLEAKHGKRRWVRWQADRHSFDAPLPDDLIGGK